MPAPVNTITTEQMIDGLNQEMIRQFDQENDRLMEILGIFGVEVLAANTTLFMTKIEGSLTEEERAEGEEVPLSQYKVVDEPVGTFMPKFYRKATTAEAILKSGYVNACSRTDDKMLTQIRAQRLAEFFGYLKNGTGTASGDTLQAVLAQVDATLNGALEDHGDETARIIHFVNRFDIADYLAHATVTTQTAYGMTYIESFLGVQDIFVTNRVPKGTVYALPVENLRIFGTDINELKKGGLTYLDSANGLIGVAHNPDYKSASTETHVISGMMLFAEVKDYIVAGTIGAAAASLSGDFAVEAVDEAESEPVDDPAVPESVDENSKQADLVAYAAAHGIDLSGCKTNASKLEAIRAAEAGE